MILNRADYIWAAAVSALALAALWPFHAYVYWVGDEGIIARAALDMLHGRRVYEDIFEFFPPTPFLLTEGWVALFGPTIAALNALAAVLSTATAAVAFLASRAAGAARLPSVVAVLAWIIAVPGAVGDLTHHSFTSLFGVLAMLATLSQRPGVAGLLCGLAGTTTQSRGALVALASASAFVRRPDERLRFVGGIVVAPALGILYLVSTGVADPAFHSIVLWPVLHYSGVQSLPFAANPSGTTFLFGWLYPALAAATILCVIREPGLLKVRRFGVAAAFALAGLFGSFPRPDVQHLAMAAPVALPLAALTWTKLASGWPRAVTIAATILPAFMLASPMIELFGVAIHAHSSHRESTPAGVAAFRERGAGELAAAVARTPPHDGIFYYPYEPLESFLSGRPHVAKMDVFVPGYTTEDQYNEACTALAGRAEWVARDRNMERDELLTSAFPRARNLHPPGRQRLERAIEAGFQTVWRRGNFELMRRRPGVAINCG